MAWYVPVSLAGDGGAERALAASRSETPRDLLAGPRHGAGMAFGRKAARFEHVTGFGNGERVEPRGQTPAVGHKAVVP